VEARKVSGLGKVVSDSHNARSTPTKGNSWTDPTRECDKVGEASAAIYARRLGGVCTEVWSSAIGEAEHEAWLDAQLKWEQDGDGKCESQ
jgi:hypothetical protein